MASLSELVQAAEYISQARGRQQSVLPKAIESFTRGITGESTAARQQVDVERAMKIMELRSKMLDMQEKQQNLQVSRNIMVGAGLLPMNIEEERIGRMSIQELLNVAKGRQAKMPKTEPVKITDAIDKAHKKILKKKELDITGDTTKGFAYKLTDKEKNTIDQPGSSGFRTEQNMTWGIATKMAIAEEREKAQREGSKYLARFEAAWYSPPTGTVIKFIPLVKEYLTTGKTEKIEKYLERRKFIDTEIDRLSEKYPVGKIFNIKGKKAKVKGYKYNSKTNKVDIQFE